MTWEVRHVVLESAVPPFPWVTLCKSFPLPYPSSKGPPSSDYLGHNETIFSLVRSKHKAKIPLGSRRFDADKMRHPPHAWLPGT